MVNIFKSLGIDLPEWCSEAVFFKVTGGKGTLVHKSQSTDELHDITFVRQLLLNGKPVIQGDFSICPTCSGMLAAGYGTENIDCPELQAVRTCLNSEYRGISQSAKLLLPLLDLLADGVYLLADIPHYPTDGCGNFFYEVPNAFTEYSGLCDELYDHNLLSAPSTFPAFLYPTQSAELCNMERVREYADILQKTDSPPRALAYYEKGFYSALLDGHHKATAAAMLGMAVNCLTIIPADAFIEKSRFDPGKPDLVGFAGILIPAALINVRQEDIFKPNRNDTPLDIKEYRLTGRRFPELSGICKQRFPTAEILAHMESALLFVEPTDENIAALIKWKERFDDESYVLKYFLEYYAVFDPERAYRIALDILKYGCEGLPCREAWKVLIGKKCETSEKMALDYIVDHTPADRCWDIVSTYWD